MNTDILITGTGMFAGRIALDIAATAKTPVSVVVAGRNTDRLDWLRTAGNARAAMFGTPARIASHQIDLLQPDAGAALIRKFAPRLVVQAASIQTSAVIADQGSRWSELVRKGGLSATAVFQCLITHRIAKAIASEAPGTPLINCSFPDVVNGMIAAMGHDVLCGTGNVAILSNIFQGNPSRPEGHLRVLAQYQCLAPWRRPASERAGMIAPRVFIDDDEIDDVFAAFAGCRLTPEPAIEVSGASGVTLMLAMIAGTPWTGHVPGPNGLPGGYPVRVANNDISLDLPQGLTDEAAIAWNDGFEQKSGLTVSGRRARFNGLLRDLLAAEHFAFADGFELENIEEVCRDMLGLRDSLLQSPPKG